MTYQFLPPLSDAEYEALREDIAQNGMRHPILVDEKGKILDGHHRARIAAELGFRPEREVLAGLSEVEKRDVAFKMNVARRHLDTAAKRAVVVASLKADPRLSDRQHARRTGVTHPTVAGIRADLEARGQVESFTTRTDAKGVEQPASRPSQPAAPAEADAQLVDDGARTTAAREAETGTGMPVEVGDGAEGPAIPSASQTAVDDLGSSPSTDAPGEAVTFPAVRAGAAPVSAPRGADTGVTPTDDRPSAWDPAERRQHEEDVRRRQDIEAAHRYAKTLVPDVRALIFTVLHGYRLGETGLVTRAMIADLRSDLDLLEKEIDGED